MDDRPAGGARLAVLLHLCDSLFPTGGYAHSDGLEAATDGGRIVTGDDLRAWLAMLLDEVLSRGDGPAVLRAWHAANEQRWDDLRDLDDEVHALRPAATVRDASRGVGTRLLKTWGTLYPSDTVREVIARGPQWTLPVAFAVAALTAGVTAGASIEAFAYTRLSATASAAMRLMRLGQLEAHGVLAEVLVRVPEMAAGVLARYDRPASFTPLADIAAMRQQYVTTRLFRS